MNETKLQLEAGKYYRTRDGLKVFIVGRIPHGVFGNTQQEWLGCIGNHHNHHWWRCDGHYWNSGEPSGNDLVAEWVEPKRIKGWVNIYPDVNGNMPSKVIVNNCLHETKEDADTHAMPMRLACIEINVLEGAGLDGEVAR